MKALVYHEASRTLIESDVDPLPQPGESFVAGGRLLIAEKIIPGEPASILARPATCHECGTRIGAGAYHIGDSIPKSSYCGPCACRLHPYEHARGLDPAARARDELAAAMYPAI